MVVTQAELAVMLVVDLIESDAVLLILPRREIQVPPGAMKERVVVQLASIEPAKLPGSNADRPVF